MHKMEGFLLGGLLLNPYAKLSSNVTRPQSISSILLRFSLSFNWKS